MISIFFVILIIDKTNNKIIQYDNFHLTNYLIIILILNRCINGYLIIKFYYIFINSDKYIKLDIKLMYLSSGFKRNN